MHVAERQDYHLCPVKRICVFEHSVIANFNCACPAIQRGQGSGFLSEGSSWLTACMSEQRRLWRDCADAQARLNLRCSHRREVPNSLDAVHFIAALWFSYKILKILNFCLRFSCHHNFWHRYQSGPDFSEMNNDADTIFIAVIAVWQQMIGFLNMAIFLFGWWTIQLPRF